MAHFAATFGVVYAPVSPLSLSASLLFRAELRCYNFPSCLPCPLGFPPLYMLILTSGFRPTNPEPEEPTSEKLGSGFMNKIDRFPHPPTSTDSTAAKNYKVPQPPPGPSLNQENPRIQSNLGP